MGWMDLVLILIIKSHLVAQLVYTIVIYTYLWDTLPGIPYDIVDSLTRVFCSETSCLCCHGKEAAVEGYSC